MNEMENNENVASQIQTYLTFRLGEEFFASNVNQVLNILEMKPITKVPKSPPYLRGAINLRGNVLPVVDLKIKFGMPPTEIAPETCIIVLNIEIEDEMVTLGILVDEVNEVLEIDEEKIEPSPTIGTKYKNELIKGMWRKTDGFIMLLNMEYVFSGEELMVVKETQAAETEQHQKNQ